MSKKKPLVKSIKAAIPFLAAFGGQGFASNRVNSVSLSSRKFAKKPVVYVDNSEKSIADFKSVQKPQVKNPFAAFTNRITNRTVTADLHEKKSVLEHLEKNQMLSSVTTQKSQITGSIKSENKKALSHTFTFYSNNSNGSEACDNVLTLANFRFNIFTVPLSTYSCTTYTSTSMGAPGTMCNGGITVPFTTSTYSTCFLQNIYGITVTAFSNINACQTMHQQCAGHVNLPVELQKFEVD